MNEIEISDSNRSVFETLTDGQRNRILAAIANGQDLEGVRVTEQIQAELRAWEMEQNALTQSLDADEPGSNDSTEESDSTNPSYTLRQYAKPLEGRTGAEQGTLRWPADVMHAKSDYVLFQFGRYQPPFANDRDLGSASTTGEDLGSADDAAEYASDYTTAGYEDYNTNIMQLDDSFPAIILPIPQDLSNEIQQVWQGKQFTAVGRAAIAGMAGAQFHYAADVVKNITGHATAALTAIQAGVLNSIPGVGGNIDFNDVSGSTRGIVINPNAELMYDSPEMREVGMVFKMVPRNGSEADKIRQICQTFRRASLPSFGGTEKDAEAFQRNSERNTNESWDMSGEDNWIRVPHLCQFTFMKGHQPHPFLTQFKPCAMSKIEVNYTPDGTYSTYIDGAPNAVEITLSFMETKVVFQEDVTTGESDFTNDPSF